jgi:hypothetical protein
MSKNIDKEAKCLYIIANMTTYKDKMTSVRLPKYIVKIIDDARAMDPLGLSQGQMIAKIVIETLGNRREGVKEV